jgi:hypothetical protein
VHPLVGVPAVEVLGLREIGVAAEQGFAEAAAEADGQGAVHLSGCALVRGAVGRPVHQAKHLTGVGQGQHQGVVAPGAVVGDVHTSLALAGGLDQEAIHIEDGPVKEGGGLLGPHAHADVVDRVLQLAEGGLVEAAAEVAGGGRVGDTLGAQGVEEDLVLAAQFEVLQAGALAQGVVGEGQDVVGLMVGEVELEQVEVAVDGVDEADLARQGVKGTDAAAADAAGAVGDLVVDVTGGEHRTLAVGHIGLVEAARDAPLAVGQLLAYLRFHSKSLWA